ncbi:hypothetical protein PR048_020153 [Dryococelus australis]|uniref:C2H2-type domain-containing protein n=1 Tax=Dryococelus australis TaxID=614101 RepID=A0ABQ9H5I0_9NEOP|nr:hypothetical protein PR048_020153 [Dryococelus australis]
MGIHITAIKLIYATSYAHCSTVNIFKICLWAYNNQLWVTGLTGAEILAEHSRYCNDYTASCADGTDGSVVITVWHSILLFSIMLLATVQMCQQYPILLFTYSNQHHGLFSYVVYIKIDNYTKPPTKTTGQPTNMNIYTGEDAGKYFMVEVVRISALSEPVCALTAGEWAGFRFASSCYLCSGSFTRANWKVHDQNHHVTTAASSKAAPKTCRFPSTTWHMMYIFIITLLGYDQDNIFIIPNTKEKLITFRKCVYGNFTIQFNDTFRFTSASLVMHTQNLLSANFQTTVAVFTDPWQFKLVQQKGKFPCDYITLLGMLDELQLLVITYFANWLTGTTISKDYHHVQMVWATFSCTSLKVYAEHCSPPLRHLQELPVAWSGNYVSTPAFSLDAMLCRTGVKLELLIYYDAHVFIEAGIWEGVAQCITACHYVNANNLYGWTMSLSLPYGGFQWIGTDIDLIPMPDDGLVDVGYPAVLHKDHHNLLSLSINECTLESRQPKLMTSLEAKTPSPSCRQLVIGFAKGCPPGLEVLPEEMNTAKCQAAANTFEQDFFKLMNKATFGTLVENKHNHQLMELVSMEVQAKNLITQARKSFLCLTGPVKDAHITLPLRCHEQHSMTLRLGLYTCTDSFIMAILCTDLKSDLTSDPVFMTKFEFSGYPLNHPCYSATNAKVINKFKEECWG